jgi:hypothetical protein
MMSGDTETVTQTSQASTRNPWMPSAGMLSGILGQLRGINPSLSEAENAALDDLLHNAGFLRQFTPQATGLANSLLSGGIDRTGLVGSAYEDYRNQLAPTTGGQFLDPESNPFFSQLTERIGNDVQNRVNAVYVGAGRDPSGAGSYGQTLGRGVAEALAPLFANAYKAERQNQLTALNALYNAGNATGGLLSQLDQIALGNMQAGIGAAEAARDIGNDPFNQVLAIEAQRRGIPLQVLAQQMGIALPIGSAFGTTTGSGTETSMMHVPWYQPVLGGALAGAGLYGAFKK